MEDHIKGLRKEQVEERKQRGQVNKKEQRKEKTNLEIIRDNICTLFNLFNFIIAIALFCVQAYSNLFFILIIIVNVAIGIIQEIHAKNLVKKLSILTVSKATVIRDQKEEEIEIEEIVLDDIIVLTMGNQISTDSIVVDGEIEVNESLLTGESETIIKKIGDPLLSGSYVVSGKCYAKVENVGDDNFSSKIVVEAKKYKKTESELLNAMKKVSKFTSFVIIPVGILLFIQAFYFRNSDIQTAIIVTSAALLGMLPKGLVLLISISLETGVIKLAKKQVLVQNLYSVETLAHVDTLCLDKTGTITEGKMKVNEVINYQEQILPISVHEAMIAFVNEMEDNNATFIALKDYFKGDISYPLLDKVPFSSERKWSALTFETLGTLIVGAPERLVAKSHREMPTNIVEGQMAGKRILAIGHTMQTIEKEELPEMELIASIELEDPLRKNAKEMLGFFKTQGVDIKIISGDSPLTVSSIAKKAGLAEYESYLDLSTISSDEEIKELVDQYAIFARVLPHQKSLIIKALQEKGHTVAMTGDGVNDVVALRQSDCSITLPEASDVARQVSQIVLLNSDFSVLKDILMEGRRVVNNITNVARIFFIKTIYSMLLSILNIVTGTPFPFIPIQITLIDLVIEGYTSFFISFEANDKKVTQPFLSSVLKKAFPYAILIILMIVAMVEVRVTLEIPIPQANTILYLLIAVISMIAVVDVCKPFNKMRIFLCTTTIVGFFVAAYLFHGILQLQPISQTGWIVFGSMAIISILIQILLNQKWRLTVKKEHLTSKKEPLT